MIPRKTRPKPTSADIEAVNAITRAIAGGFPSKAHEIAMKHRIEASSYATLQTTQKVIAWDNDTDGEEGLKELCMRIREEMENL